MLSAAWQRILAMPDPPVAQLVTVNLYGANPSDPVTHLALQAGSIRLASMPACDVGYSGGTMPFAPYLAGWTPIEQRYVPEHRRMEIAEFTTTILADSDIAAKILDAGTAERATARVDLWAPGIALEGALPRICGRVSGPARITRRDGAVALSIVDGDPDLDARWPAGPITRDEFPAAPDFVVGAFERRPILGAFPHQVICPQIDDAALEFYLCDGDLTVEPTSFYVNGIDTSLVPRIVSDVTATSGARYWKLVFASPVYDLALPAPVPAVVSCSGGHGTHAQHPIVYLLELAGYRISADARRVLASTPFRFSVLAGRSGSVLSIVRDQLIPQTNMVFGFRRGEVVVRPVESPGARRRIGLGAGLLYRLGDSDQSQDPGLEAVFNHIEVRAGRNEYAAALGGDGFLTTVTRRAGMDGPLAARERLRASQERYRHRYLQVSAPDLEAAVDQSGRWTSAEAELLADTLAAVHAMPYRRHAYKATWLDGLSLADGDEVLLTDPSEGLTDALGVVARHRITATGPEITIAVRGDAVT